METNQESIKNRIEEEHKNHQEKVISCIKCYPLLNEKSRQEYVNFWSWITNHGAIMGTGATEILFDYIINSDIEEEKEENLRRKVTLLLKSIQYNKNYQWTDNDIDNAWGELKAQNYFRQESTISENKEKQKSQRRNYSRSRYRGRLRERGQTSRSNTPSSIPNLERSKSREKFEEKDINTPTILTSPTTTQQFFKEINLEIFENENN